MKTKLSAICVFLLLIAISAQAKEKLILDAAGVDADAVRGARIEIWRQAPKGERKLAHRAGAAEAISAGLDLEEGTYEIYLENKSTGLIYRLNDVGKGVKLSKGKVAKIDTTGFGARIREIKQKDAAERPAKAEALRRAKDKKAELAAKASSATQAEATAAATGTEVHAPGELLIKFRPDTTLADRYAVMSELSAEARSKLDQLDVYRVKLSEAADLPAVIRTYVDDPRIKYMEMNMTVSVPEPVGEGR